MSYFTPTAHKMGALNKACNGKGGLKPMDKTRMRVKVNGPITIRNTGSKLLTAGVTFAGIHRMRAQVTPNVSMFD